jgi:hypothetical protein
MTAAEKAPTIPVDLVGARLRPDHRHFGTASGGFLSGYLTTLLETNF